MPTFGLAAPAQRFGALEAWRAANTARGNAPVPSRIARVKTKLADPSALLVVGCDGDVVIAMALAEPARQDFGAGPTLPGTGHISMVFVAPERWRQGIGAQLMEYLHDQMRSRGWELASLWTRKSNQPARRLYTGCGYRQTADIKALDGRDDIVRYELRLRLCPAS
jgi:ribosomal protein S18 acetylase RimI-like enzyme